ncbi:Acyl transferase/acyl hydrolase/lysophospholipase [Penicillium coprophilum]|uniref:Acyl transferase/acyl hydrolase/lysophospholipase n=1 Tax=Penicillium coprophilum TaxID=36646 RepID=UPI0023A78E4A|nr:Acyl transferase/acyl hydrolase/lysophospholipase [Penicillium coprophilum]KAJ5170212.1 Acyl transferase/acyl hydrolase/lysophospholipase [Penicillium coprophilum]
MESINHTRAEPIAIVGMALPGLRTLTDVLRMRPFGTRILNGKEKRINNKGGYYLRHNLAHFDAPFFRITANEAKAMDPQQRFLLEITYEALENGGFPMEEMAGKNVAVFAANSFSDYLHGITRDPETAPTFAMTGCDPCMIANRVSHFFDFRGPSITVDTACSSGLTAIHLACQTLRSGDAPYAIVTAAHLNIYPQSTIIYSLSQLLSPEGKCYAFDDRATGGFGRGEGAASLVLKPLSAALEAGDHIYTVIKNTGVNQDGRTNAGLTVPSGEAQESLIRSVYASCGLDPSQTRYVEAHGTGTAVGDPIEVGAIANIFGKQSASLEPAFIGSAKSNFGHLEGVSGLASVIKTAMMLEKGMLLPNTNFTNPNPKLHLEENNLQVLTEIQPWPKSGARRASINNFGIGGSNSHGIFEQAPPRPSQKPSKCSYIFALSANSEYSNRVQLSQLSTYVRKHPPLFNQTIMEDLAFTLSARRSLLPWKTVITANSHTQLIEKLNAESLTPTRSTKRPLVGLVFTGQGAHWPQMGQELVSYPVFQKSLQKSQVILQELGATWELQYELFRSAEDSQLGVAQISQVACCVIQIALVDLLRSWGLDITAVVGHSSGEIAAGYAAGHLSAATCIKVAYHRGMAAVEIKKQFPNVNGSMIAVGCSEAVLQPLLASLVCGLATIACKNSTSSFTVSGDRTAIEELHALCNAQNIFNRILSVDVAYHSSHMELVAESYLAALSEIDCVESSVKFFSSTKGSLLGKPTFDNRYWTSNLTGKVLFSDSLSAMCRYTESINGEKRAIDILVEVGPHAALKGPVSHMLKSIARDQDVGYFPTLVRGKNGIHTMHELAASLFSKGLPIDLQKVNFDNSQNVSKQFAVLGDLPSYPWKHEEEYWHESRINKFYRTNKVPYNDLLGSFATDFNNLEPRWRSIIRLDDLPWLRDHRVQSEVVFPMAGYISMAIEAVSQYHLLQGKTEGKSYILREVLVKHPLILSEMVEYDVTLSLRPCITGPQTPSTKWYEFAIFSCTGDLEFEERCRGKISVSDKSQIRVKSDQISPDDFAGVELDNTNFYTAVKNTGVEYGASLLGLFDIKATGCKAIAKMRIPETATNMPSMCESAYVLHPATVNILMQTALVLLHSQPGGLDKLYIPRYIEEIEVRPLTTLAAGKDLAIGGTISNTSPDDPVFSIFAQHIGGTFISINGLQCRGQPLPEISSAMTDFCHKLEWMPWVDILSPNEMRRAFEVPSNGAADEKSRIRLLKNVSLYYMHKALEQLGDYGGSRYVNMYRWMKEKDQELWENTLDEQQGQDLIQNARQSGPVGKLLCRMGENLVQVVREEVEPLSLLLEDDLLTSYYENLEPLKNQSELAHLGDWGWNRGATLPILQALSDSAASGHPIFESYVFTDVSAGFFEKSKLKLQAWKHMLEFRILNIETSPEEQGLIEESYDLIIAVNVLHATVNMSNTMKNVRSLLKPGGKLLLLEITRPDLTLFPFTSLPGWWLGEEEFRQNGPTLSPMTWDRVLKSAGFSGIQAELQDYPNTLEQENSLIVSSATASDQWSPSDDLTIVTSGSSGGLAEALKTSLTESLGITVRVMTLEAIATEHNILKSWIVLEDFNAPLLHSINKPQYWGLQRIGEADRSLWVVAGANQESVNPRPSMTLGLARSIREENHHLKLVVLDLDLKNQLPTAEAAAMIHRVFSHSFIKADTPLAELELSERNGIIHIPRYKPDAGMNQLITDTREQFAPRSQAGLDGGHVLKMRVQSTEASKGFIFVDNGLPLPAINDLDVEIEVKASGVSFQDVLVTNSNVNEDLGYECSGVITAIGLGVQDLGVGDRVCALTRGTYASVVRCPSVQVVKIPDEMTYTTAAAIPMAFVTAYYSLVTVGHLKQDETILIHQAAGGVGQMAVRIAQSIGAKVYATVVSVEKKEAIADYFQIPFDHIFCADQVSSYEDLMNATTGRGYDVVVNTQSNEALHVSWKCMALHGRFVNLALAGTSDENHLSMKPFNIGASFLSINLEALMKTKPELLHDILTRGIEWYTTGMIEPAMSPKCYPVGAIEDAFNHLSQGDSIGKLVIDLSSPGPVLAIKDESCVPLFTPDESYLVMDGGDSIGRSIIRWMGRRGAKNIIIMTRSGSESPKVRELESEMRMKGIRLAIYQGDFADANSLEHVIQESSKILPPIRGVIHSDAVLRTMLFETMPFEDYCAVVSPRVQGAWNLHQCFSDSQSLRFFIIISSITGTVGTPIHAAYGAATTYLGSLARMRKAQGLPGISVDLGPVIKVGGISEQRSRQQVIDKDWGDEGLTEMDVNNILDTVISGQYDPSWDAECYTCLLPSPLRVPFWFADSRFIHCRHPDLVGEQGIDSIDDKPVIPLGQLLSNSQSAEEDRSIIYEAIVGKFVSVLSLHPDDIVPSSPPSTYGVDSLVASEIRNWIAREMKASLSLPELMSSASFVELSNTITQRYRVAVGA